MFKLFIPKLSVKMQSIKSVPFSTKAEIYEIMKTHLQCSNELIDDLFKKKWKSISHLPKFRLIRNCKTLKKCVNIKKSEYLLSLLLSDPVTLKNKIMLLEEMGAKIITLNLLYRFPVIINKSVNAFQTVCGIPEGNSIIHNMFNSVGLDIKDLSFETLFGELDTKSMRASKCYMICMGYYKMYHLNLVHHSLLKHYQIKYESFRKLTAALDILENDFQFSRDFLSEHPYLLHACSDNLNSFLTKLKDVRIGDISMLELAKENPRILCYDVCNTMELLTLFKELNIQPESVIRYTRIFTLTKATFLERYQSIMKNPNMSVWSTYSRILYAVLRYDTFIARVGYLNIKKHLGNTNVHAITADNEFFSRYVQGNTARTAGQKYLLYLISKEFGNDKTYLIRHIMRHPHWKTVTLNAVENMVQFLKKHYSIEDLCPNIQIILYPKDKVIATLEEIRKKYTREKGYNFTTSQYLALCVYTMEKKNHFTGDAVWPGANSNNDDDSMQNNSEDSEDEMKDFV